MRHKSLLLCRLHSMLWVRTCIVLLSLIVTAFSLQLHPLYAAKPYRHTVSIHPLYKPAGNPLADKTFGCQKPGNHTLCYAPQQIRTAYSIQPLLNQGITGKGSSIVILNAYQAPNLQADLALFSKTFHLPEANLVTHAPDGLTPFNPLDADHLAWSGEITLDVEWAHAIAPDATIHLVLAKTNNDADLVRALRYAVEKDLGDVISMSFGENETCLEPELDREWHTAFAEATRKKITLFAASGDTGGAQLICDGNSETLSVSTPAINPLVTAVGGTELNADLKTGEYFGERSWNEPELRVGTGGGYSTKTLKPPYQFGVNSSKYRAVPDVSYNAAINGGVLVAWSDGDAGPGAFYINGGTSAGAPQWAAILALAKQIKGERLGFINQGLYQLGQSADYYNLFYDITTDDNTIQALNSNSNFAAIPGYPAIKGWDASTGWGSPIASKLVPALIKYTEENKFNVELELRSLVR